MPKFKYFETTVTILNYVYNEIKNRLNSENVSTIQIRIFEPSVSYLNTSWLKYKKL
jgi:hypothetical protein